MGDLSTQLAYDLTTRGGVMVPVATGRAEKITGRLRRTGVGGCYEGIHLQPRLTAEQRGALGQAAINLTGRLHSTTKQKYPIRLKAQDVLRAALARAEGNADLESLISAELHVAAVETAAARAAGQPQGDILSFDTSPAFYAPVAAMAARCKAYYGARLAPSRVVAAVASLWLHYPAVWEAAFGDDPTTLTACCDLARQDQAGRIRAATTLLKAA